MGLIQFGIYTSFHHPRCTPHSGEGEDYSTIDNILEASVNVMVNLMGSYVSFAWTIAAPFIDDLVSGIDTEELEDEQLTAEFLYPRDWYTQEEYRWPDNAGCWYWWKVIVKTEQTVKFDIFSGFVCAEDAHYSHTVLHSWTPTINAPPPFPSNFPAAKRL